MATTFISGLSGKSFPIEEKVPGKSIRDSVLKLIRQDHPDFDPCQGIAMSELNIYRERYITDYLNREVGELSDLEKKVLDSMKNHSSVCCAKGMYKEPEPSVADRLADRMTRFGGSWGFVILFGSIIVAWMGLNIFWLSNPAFDPYPFVLLNLMLSYLSTLQAPIIMMSQNRQSAIDRRRSQDDYTVNLKSEIEVRTLHEKIDHLMMYQQQELIEIQKVQIDMLTELLKTMEKTRKERMREKKTQEIET